MAVPTPPTFPTSQHSLGSLAITLKDGNAIYEQTDVLVNAASTSGLGIGGWGGIAGQVRDKIATGGVQQRVLQDDWAQGVIDAGSARFVKNRGVPYKFSSTLQGRNGPMAKECFLIHAGSPSTSRGVSLNKDGKDKLEAAYFNILKEMQDYNTGSPRPPKPIRSVTIPPLGVGIFQVSPEESARCAAKAIAKFNQQFPTAAFQITVPLFTKAPDPQANQTNINFGTALKSDLEKLARGEDLSATTPVVGVRQVQQVKPSAPRMPVTGVRPDSARPVSRVGQGTTTGPDVNWKKEHLASIYSMTDRYQGLIEFAKATENPRNVMDPETRSYVNTVTANLTIANKLIFDTLTHTRKTSLEQLSETELFNLKNSITNEIRRTRTDSDPSYSLGMALRRPFFANYDEQQALVAIERDRKAHQVRPDSARPVSGVGQGITGPIPRVIPIDAERITSVRQRAAQLQSAGPQTSSGPSTPRQFMGVGAKQQAYAHAAPLSPPSSPPPPPISTPFTDKLTNSFRSAVSRIEVVQDTDPKKAANAVIIFHTYGDERDNLAELFKDHSPTLGNIITSGNKVIISQERAKAIFNSLERTGAVTGYGIETNPKSEVLHPVVANLLKENPTVATRINAAKQSPPPDRPSSSFRRR